MKFKVNDILILKETGLPRRLVIEIHDYPRAYSLETLEKGDYQQYYRKLSIHYVEDAYEEQEVYNSPLYNIMKED